LCLGNCTGGMLFNTNGIWRISSLILNGSGKMASGRNSPTWFTMQHLPKRAWFIPGTDNERENLHIILCFQGNSDAIPGQRTEIIPNVSVVLTTFDVSNRWNLDHSLLVSRCSRFPLNVHHDLARTEKKTLLLVIKV